MPLPFLAAAGIGAVAGAAENIFGESEEEKANRQKRQQITALLKSIERERARGFDEKVNVNRDFSSFVADRRQATNQKLSQEGFSPVGSVGSNEKDLVEGSIKQKEDIDSNVNKFASGVHSEVDQITAGMQTEPGFGEKLFSGAVKGFNLGSSIYGAAVGNKDLNPDDTGNTIKKLKDKSGNKGLGVEDIMNYMNRKKKLSKTGNVSLPEEAAFQY